MRKINKMSHTQEIMDEKLDQLIKEQKYMNNSVQLNQQPVKIQSVKMKLCLINTCHWIH